MLATAEPFEIRGASGVADNGEKLQIVEERIRSPRQAQDERNNFEIAEKNRAC
jgi:hypothetical protein